MKKTILRFTLSAVLLVAAFAVPALATGPGDPPPPTQSSVLLVVLVSSLIPL